MHVLTDSQVPLRSDDMCDVSGLWMSEQCLCVVFRIRKFE